MRAPLRPAAFPGLSAFWIAGIFFLGALLSSAQAQTTVMLSNLSGASPGNTSTMNDNSEGSYNLANAGSFTTGSTGTLLSSITLGLLGGSGTGFSVGLYSNSSNTPGTLLETLTGETAPTAAGNYTYTSGGSTVLNANTTYWWVASVPSDSNSVQFNLDYSNAGPEIAQAGWSYGSNSQQQNAGAWNSYDSPTLKFSVTTGSAIPEPSTYAALFGLSALGLAAYRRKQRPA